ncbi:MAG: tRNA epoxyqueuosine(34) reductase QueG [Desulfobulbaceae bacterium]|nr:tRNA epoxyqueuosine(34) reductase QueG [Desulfobulbaceae bacterium]
MSAGKALISTIILCEDKEHELPKPPTQTAGELAALKNDILRWGEELGFQQIGVSDIDLAEAETRLEQWLDEGCHGSMQYMDKHGTKRSRPDELVPGTMRVISARMDYLPQENENPQALLDHESRAYVSRYALGRDYHKVLRRRLQKLASKIEARIGAFGYRVFVDSAPVLEKPIAEKAGIGWIGKHTNIINKEAGSWFFLGELYTDLPLPVDAAAAGHCGTCRACMDVCPTQAIVAPYKVDARRCISYLTIENREAIPVEFRQAIGNRIYGCDDCQIFCPWNKFAKPTTESDFALRHGLNSAALTELFAWSEETWFARTEGSAIRRIGYESWLRNIAVALGNAATAPEIIAALETRRYSESNIVAEHVEWALAQHDSNNYRLTEKPNDV